MLQNLSEKIRLCYERAAEAKERAGEMLDPQAKLDFLRMEHRWLLLARSYQFSDSLEDFTRFNASQSSSHHSLKRQPGGGAECSSAGYLGPGDATRVLGHEADVAVILANTRFLLTRCSCDLRYLFVNEACARMYGLRPEDLEGKLITDIMGEEAFRTILPYVKKVLRGEDVEYECEIPYAGAGLRRVFVRYTPDRDRSGSVKGWVASILDLTDQRKAEAQAAVDLRAMTILRQVGSLYVQQDLRTDECLQRTIDSAISIVGADKGNIQIFDDGSNSLIIAAHRGFAEPFKQVASDASACAAAMQTKGQVIVEDVLHSDIFAGQQSQAVLLDAGVRAVVSTPLMSSSGILMGMISTHYANPHRPTDREVHLLELLARQAADYLACKRAERTEKMLLRELNHRCNNLLAVVQAIANNSLSTRDTIADARNVFIARLQALARVNRHILKSEWTRVDLHTLIESELEPFRTSVTVEGLPVIVDPQRAQIFAMALHELLTNASKYGALSSVAGKVHVSWKITHENEPVLHFRWRESGGPHVVAPGRQGFGTTLLKGIFAEVRFDYLEEGLDCAFDMRL